MKNILYPTDFSLTSRCSIPFLIEFANKTGASIHILNIFSVNIYDPNMPAELMMSAYQQAEASSKENLDLLKKELEGYNQTHGRGAQSTYNLFTISRQGLVVDEILNYVEDNNIDIVVMGTTGASGILEKIIGSNAASVIEKCPKPVLAIPDKAEFRGINNIVYATDLEEKELNEIKILAGISKLFNAELTLLHVCNEKETAIMEDKEKIFNELKVEIDYMKTNLEMVQNENVINGIDDYVSKHKTDIISMATHRRSLLGKIFDRSLTKQMAYHTRIPLLALERES